MDKVNCVYQFPWKDDNCNKSYVGQTKNYSKTRMAQHELSIKKCTEAGSANNKYSKQEQR